MQKIDFAYSPMVCNPVFFLSRGELCKARKEYASYGREKPIRKNKKRGTFQKGKWNVPRWGVG